MAAQHKPAYSPRLLAQEGAFSHGSVAIDELHVDHSYQRPLNERRVEDIIGSFDARLCLPPAVSQRADGSFWVVEGQHRTEVLRRLGRSIIDAYIYTGLSVEDEARLFRLLNIAPVRPTAWDVFRARLVSGDPVATGIVRVVEAAGAKVAASSTRSLFHISAVRALEKVYVVSPDLLRQTISVIQACWPDPADSWARDGVFIQAVAVFLRSFGKSIDNDRMLRVFSSLSALQIQQQAKRMRAEEGGSEFNAALVARALLANYNGRLRTGVLTGRLVSLTGSGRALGQVRR